MPPRLQLRALATPSPPSTSLISAFLVPFLQRLPQCNPQIRHASILSDLRNTPGSYKKRIRRGRGPSSGKGGKSGRGTHGQKARGKVPVNFQGGQTPDGVVHGKFGFKNVHATEMSPINLDTIQSWINDGRLNAKEPITLRELASSRAVHGIKDGIKLLGRGSTSLTSAVHLIVSRASQSAISAVEALGGTVTTRFYSPLSIRRITMGEMHPYISLRWDQAQIGNPTLMLEGAETPELRVKGMGYNYRLPDPTKRKDLEYYRDKANNGYLAHSVSEGANPSLYYKSEMEVEEARKAKIEKRAEDERLGLGVDAGLRGEGNKLW